MARNARTQRQLLSVYYKIIPYHVRLLNVLSPIAIKILRLLETMVGRKSQMHNDRSTNYKHCTKNAVWVLPCSHSFPWLISRWNWMDQPCTTSTSKLHWSIYVVERLKVQNMPEMSFKKLSKSGRNFSHFFITLDVRYLEVTTVTVVRGCLLELFLSILVF